MKQILFIFLLLFSTINLNAINLEKALKMLEATGDYETAEPIAFNLTQKKKEFFYYIHFLKQYPYSDFTDTVYEQTWKFVKNKSNKKMFTSIIKVRPKGKYSYDALIKLFELYKKENLIVGYQEFMKNFPNAPQAIKALKSIHKLGFQRAVKLNTVKGYDTYILNFKGSTYIEKAKQKAKDLEVDKIHNELNDKLSLSYWTSGQERKESVARKLYNEMRKAEKYDNTLLFERNYYLLEQNLFLNTKVVTEALDREELIDFRKVLLNTQRQTHKKLEQLGELFKSEFQKTREMFDNKLSNLTDSIGELSYEKGRIADAIYEQTQSLEEAAREASRENQRLFNEAKENSQNISRKNRECAELLSERGEYPWYSGCP